MADEIRATPRSPLFGLFSDIVNVPLDYMSDPRRSQQMQGLAAMLRGTGVPSTLQNLSYDPSGRGLFTGAGGLGGTTRMRPEAIEALMTVAPGVGPAARVTKGLPVGMSIKDAGSKFNVATRDASEIFGAGSARVKYTEPNSGGSIEVLRKPDGSASVLSLEVPEKFRGQKIGESLQAQAMQDFPVLQGQVSSKAAAKTAYRLGRRPPGQPEASLDDVYKIMDEYSSVNLVSPTMQRQVFMPSPAPQEEALRLAQQRAALPIEQGGLGLPANNTAMDRAKAMGGKDLVHFSRTGGDYQSLDSGQYAQAPFDAVGTHVGSKEAALDRFRNTVGTTDSIKGATYPVTILGNRPLMNQSGMPWGEDELNAFLRQSGEYNSPNVRMTYPQMNAELRKKLFDEQGYTSIPYINEVEGKGSTSFIVPPENIRSRFAAFDPFRRNAAIAATMGVAAPDLLASPLYTDPFANTIGDTTR